MCGRFTLTHPEALEPTFGVTVDRIPPPRYNIAPSQPVGVIVQRPDAPPEFRLQRWGLIPAWAKDPAKVGNGFMNARLETAHEKPSFRTAFRRRRCLIPADGFYEWMKVDHTKQPIYFQTAHQTLFAFAGLWETWQDIETCTILTRTASPDIRPVHHRMPVIVPPSAYQQWLAPQLTLSEQIIQHLDHWPIPSITATPVGTLVNSASVDGPDCIQPVPAPPQT